MYRIPIAFYDPMKRLPKNESNAIFQQLDILPTLLDLLNVETTYYAYGNSYFNSTHREGVTFLEGALYYFHSNQLITFTKEKARNLQVVATKKGESRQPLPINHQTKIRLEKRIKSMIQRYNSDLIRNKMTVE
jgi:arylsulfatase A-like enzyme